MDETTWYARCSSRVLQVNTWLWAAVYGSMTAEMDMENGTSVLTLMAARLMRMYTMKRASE